MDRKIKTYSEAELIGMFGLTCLVGNKKHPLMEEWTGMGIVTLSAAEQVLFDEKLFSVHF